MRLPGHSCLKHQPGSSSGEPASRAQEQILSGRALAVYLAFFSLSAGMTPIAEMMKKAGASDSGRLLLVALVVFPAAWGMNEAGGEIGLFEALGFLLYVAVPSVFLSRAARSRSSPTLLDWLAILVIWLPVEAGWPKMPASAGIDPQDLRRLLGLVYLLVAFQALRPISDLGYRWRLALGDLGTAVTALAGASAGLAAISISGWVDMGRWASGASSPWIAGSLILTAVLPAEFLHRGLIFGFLQKGFHSKVGPYPALALRPSGPGGRLGRVCPESFCRRMAQLVHSEVREPCSRNPGSLDTALGSLVMPGLRS